VVTLRDRWGSKLKPRNFPLLAVPGVILIALLSWLVFQLQSTFNDANPEKSSQVEISRSQVAFSGPESFFVGKGYVEDLGGVLGSVSPETFLKNNVSCSSLDKAVTSDMNYFTYESRISALESVKNYDQANRFLGNNFGWALDVGYSSRYANKSEKYLSDLLRDKVKVSNSDQVNWSSAGSQIRPAALKFCDLSDVYDSSLEALQKLDGQIARAINFIVN
jgi:hypothetical protein